MDRRVDRRYFLEYMGRLTASAAAGVALTPRGAAATRAVFPGNTTLPDPSAIRATDLWDLTLTESAALIRSREISPVELVEAYLARIEAFDEVLMAFNTVTADAARAEARRAADLPWSGPLHGIPLAIKDNYYTAGVLTTANSHIFRDFVPEFDATTWGRLKNGGAILLGKTQMGPLATSRATTPDGANTTLNAWAPHDPSVTPGGSSSGSATAVAARLAASATGTQTGGSITSPSSEQGLTGIKPTMGRASLYGIVPLTYTRDHPGPLARDARDAAVMLQAMAGPDPADPRTLGHPPVGDYVRAAEPVTENGKVRLRRPLTVGVVPGYLDEPEEPTRFGREEVSDQERDRRLAIFRARGRAEIAARRAMLRTFEELGARVVEVPLPADWDLLTGSDFNNVRLPERSEPFLKHLREDVRLFGVSLSPWINGLLLSGPEYLRGQRAKMVLLQRVLDGIFEECDVVVQTSPIPFDIIGLPLIAFPVGMEDTRGFTLPVAGMLGGAPWEEEALLSLVGAYQAVTDWHRRRAPDAPSGRGDGAGDPGGAAAGASFAAGASLDRGRTGVQDVAEHSE
ncbi:MAG: amidase [Gemmatimonadota bacterium]|nr:amidase [Gemmatimonadota bacterium]